MAASASTSTSEATSEDSAHGARPVSESNGNDVVASDAQVANVTTADNVQAPAVTFLAQPEVQNQPQNGTQLQAPAMEAQSTAPAHTAASMAQMMTSPQNLYDSQHPFEPQNALSHLNAQLSGLENPLSPRTALLALQNVNTANALNGTVENFFTQAPETNGFDALAMPDMDSQLDYASLTTTGPASSLNAYMDLTQAPGGDGLPAPFPFVHGSETYMSPGAQQEQQSQEQQSQEQQTQEQQSPQQQQLEQLQLQQMQLQQAQVQQQQLQQPQQQQLSQPELQLQQMQLAMTMQQQPLAGVSGQAFTADVLRLLPFPPAANPIHQNYTQALLGIDRSPEHQPQNNPDDPDGSCYSCTYHGCETRLDTATQLQRHKREVHRSNGNRNDIRNTQAGPHRCRRFNPSSGKRCDSVFSRPYDLTRHEDTIHNVRKEKAKCCFCPEEKCFSRNDALTRHMRVVHPDIQWPGKVKRRSKGGDSGHRNKRARHAEDAPENPMPENGAPMNGGVGSLQPAPQLFQSVPEMQQVSAFQQQQLAQAQMQVQAQLEQLQQPQFMPDQQQQQPNLPMMDTVPTLLGSRPPNVPQEVQEQQQQQEQQDEQPEQQQEPDTKVEKEEEVQNDDSMGLH